MIDPREPADTMNEFEDLINDQVCCDDYQVCDQEEASEEEEW